MRALLCLTAFLVTSAFDGPVPVRSEERGEDASACAVRAACLAVKLLGREVTDGEIRECFDQSARRTFPYTSTNYVHWRDGKPIFFSAVSPHAHLLAYLQPEIHAKIDFTDLWVAVAWAPPYTGSTANADLMHLPIPAFACPSDEGPPGRNNYRANLGPGPWITHPHFLRPVPGEDPANGTGAFVNGRTVDAAEFTDGLSTTALFSERVVGDGDPALYTP